MMTFGIFVCLAFVSAAYSAEENCYSQHSCRLENLGCFTDQFKARAMPELLLNERDATSKKANGKMIDWGNFKKYISDFACRCAKIAFRKGYSVIGLQFYGECWSGPHAEETYDMHGVSKNCIGGDFQTYDMNNTRSCAPFVGKGWTNQVYRLASRACDEKFQPVGCFHDDMIPPRPVPNYIMNERDFTAKGWNGRYIDWGNWKTYSPGMICRCAKAARARKHDYFAIQYWGECWSGVKSDVKFDRNGGSTMCRDENFKQCTCSSYNCVGMASTNYVYELNEAIPFPCK